MVSFSKLLATTAVLAASTTLATSVFPEASFDHAQTLAKWTASQSELESLLNDPKALEARFQQFIQEKYGETPADVRRKRAAFRENVVQAHKRNLKSGGRVAHGITNLMDLDEAQFTRMLGLKVPEDYKQGQGEEILESRNHGYMKKSAADEIDWRQKGAVTDVKDQGQCGSCWAFSATESVESAALAQGLVDAANPFVGAPQELVSCDSNGNDQGCNGGLPDSAFTWFKTHGVVRESDYPYTSGQTQRTGTCKLTPGQISSEGVFEVVKDTAVSIWGIGENEDMKDWIMNNGPLSVSLHANSSWQTYQGGVLSIDDCPDSQPNHAVQGVALKADEETGYWVIRNSWAASWGEDGFIRLAYNKNVCNVAFGAYGVEVKKNEGAEPVENVFV